MPTIMAIEHITLMSRKLAPAYNKQNVLDMIDAIEHGGDYFIDAAGNFEALAFVVGSIGKVAKMAKRVGNIVKSK